MNIYAHNVCKAFYLDGYVHAPTHRDIVIYVDKEKNKKRDMYEETDKYPNLRRIFKNVTNLTV